jgi:hypothetical protein
MAMFDITWCQSIIIGRIGPHTYIGHTKVPEMVLVILVGCTRFVFVHIT